MTTSKVAVQKWRQAYVESAACCKTCKNFSSEFKQKFVDSDYVEERNKRCGIGGFAVQSSGHCRLFERQS